MSVHYKFLLDKRRKRQDKIYPLKLRVYDNDGNKEKSLGINLHENDWDDELQQILISDPDYKNNSFKFNGLRNKVERKVLLAEDDEDLISPDTILSTLNKKRKHKNKISFKVFSDELIAGMLKAGKAGNAMAYTDATRSLINFYGNDNVRFEDITYKLLDKYNTFMLARSAKVNTVAAYLRSIRAIYNKAIKAELVDSKLYPFSKFTIETEDTISRALTLQEMQQIVRLHLKPNTPIWHNRNYFIISFCLIGINFADLFTLEPKNMRENRIAYRRNKTGRIYNIDVPPVVLELVHRYKSIASKNENKYILPTLLYTTNSLQERKNIKQLCKNCNDYMKQIAKICGIDKPITTYYARYTWANIAKKDLGYSNDLIADALGHQYGNKVTGIYLDNYSNETIDAANKAVIDSVFK